MTSLSVPLGTRYEASNRAHGVRRPLAALMAFLIPSVADVVFMMCLIGAVAISGRMLSADGDASRHLTVGEHIIKTGAIPVTDLFSHTMAGKPFVAYEWLAEVADALSFRAGGLAGLLLLHGLAIGLTWAIVLRLATLRSGTVLVPFAVTALGVTASAVHWLARPHVFTFLGLAIFTSMLDRWQAGRAPTRRLWVLPAVMVVWANLHGGFLVGYLVLATYVAADTVRGVCAGAEQARQARARLRALLPVALLTAAAPLLNPAGPALFAHVTGYFGQRFLVDNTQEYMSPNFHDRSVWLFAALLLAVCASMAWGRQRPSLHHGMLAMGFAFCALYSARNIPLFAIVAVPIVVTQLVSGRTVQAGNPESGTVVGLWGAARAWMGRRDRRYSSVDGSSQGHLWPAFLVGGLLLIASTQQRLGGHPLGVTADSRLQPVDAVSFLKAAPPDGLMFNDFIWGGYLLHELWPAHKVFIDGQTDFYGEALTREYVTVMSLAPGWEGILERRGVRWMIVRSDSALVERLRRDPDWRTSYQDGLATVLERSPGPAA